MGRSQDRIDSYYFALDNKLIPCQTAGSLGGLDELFKVHYIFNMSYDNALINFYTFLQTTVSSIDVGKTKESPRVKERFLEILKLFCSALDVKGCVPMPLH
ncbi:hypothetical protein QQF64_036284 [Cirrhinus molitorella]|uniref:Uncharacterized protein n=1 Tax=Cirrhinus molitorella TaxID=172907 RepID=A0ABR3NIP4_9TELE